MKNILKFQKHTVNGDIYIIGMTIALILSGCTSGSISVRARSGFTDIAVLNSEDCRNQFDAMRHLDIECSFDGSPDDANKLWDEFRNTLLDQQAQTDSVLLALHKGSSDPTIQETARTILLRFMEDRGAWRALDSISRFLNERPTSLAQTAASVPEMTISLTVHPDTLMVEFNSWDVPIVEVMINGTLRRFWLDTGASEMVISSDVAEEIGIFPKEGMIDTIPTATSSVPGSPAIIEHLVIGKSRFNSVPCILLDERYLHKKIFSLFTEYKIDGIIGWRVLKELDILIDYTGGCIVISKPRRDVQLKNNLLFFERPYVRLTDTAGRPLLMFLDTGAEFSSFFPEFVLRYPGMSSHWALMSYQGVGGSSVRFGRKIDSISIPYGEWMIHLRDLPVLPISKKEFVSHDGLLGSDLFRTGRIRLDWTNRTFEYTPSIKQ